MKDKEIKLSITLEQLKILLNEQKEVVCEKLSEVNRNGKLVGSDGKVDNATIKNQGKSADFPKDIAVLSKYFIND